VFRARFEIIVAAEHQWRGVSSERVSPSGIIASDAAAKLVKKSPRIMGKWHGGGLARQQKAAKNAVGRRARVRRASMSLPLLAVVGPHMLLSEKPMSLGWTADYVPPPYASFSWMTIGERHFSDRDYEREALRRQRLEHLWAITAWGHTIWNDQHIPGSVDWLAELEERLTSCILQLAFLSQAAVDSKWIQREIHFADGLNKSILPVWLEPIQLRGGLKLVLYRSQHLTISDPAFKNKL
jgi:TIR domain-containing protein